MTILMIIAMSYLYAIAGELNENRTITYSNGFQKFGSKAAPKALRHS